MSKPLYAHELNSWVALHWLGLTLRGVVKDAYSEQGRTYYDVFVSAFPHESDEANFTRQPESHLTAIPPPIHD